MRTVRHYENALWAFNHYIQEGASMTLGELRHRLTLVSGCLPDSEGFSYTSSPEDYEPCDVIFSDDESEGILNPNTRGDNLFEVQYECHDGCTDTRDENSIIYINYTNFSL